MMGHKGDIEARYSTNKGVLPPDMIEDMRKCYTRMRAILKHSSSAFRAVSIVKEAKIEARGGPEHGRVQKLLDHLARYTMSESSREKYLNLLYRFCLWSSMGPEELRWSFKKWSEVLGSEIRGRVC